MLDILAYATLAGLATTFGALFILWLKPMGDRSLSLLLGLAAGVMLAVIAFDLIPSVLSLGTWRDLILGVILGALFLLFIRYLLTKLNHTSSEPRFKYRRLGYLMAIGIALHDLPEGMSIALGYASTETLGPAITLAICIHNIPEGMATAAPLCNSGVSKNRIILLMLLISAVTPLGCFLGLILAQCIPEHLSVLLAVAAGCMLYLSQFELIPEALKYYPWLTLVGVCIGSIAMWIFCH